MQTRLNAATDIATFILFDPEALPSEDVDPKHSDATLKNAASTGKAVGYSYASDGDANVLLLVDESPEDRLCSRKDRSHAIESGYLNVPSGRLVFTGFEDLWGTGEKRYSPGRFSPEMGQECEIPPGHYRVDAFEVDWSEEVEEKISSLAKPGDKRIETILGVSMGCVLFATILVVPGAFFIVWKEASLSTALKFLLYVLVFEVVFWGVMIPVGARSKAWKRMDELRTRIECAHPSVVIQLTRIDAPPREFRLGVFGEGLAHLKE